MQKQTNISSNAQPETPAALTRDLSDLLEDRESLLIRKPKPEAAKSSLRYALHPKPKTLNPTPINAKPHKLPGKPYTLQTKPYNQNPKN